MKEHTKTAKYSAFKLNPGNPRFIRDEKFKALVKSIRDFPEMLELRPIVVDEGMMVLGGNMRLRACKEAGVGDIPYKVARGLTEAQKREFIIKDNAGFGEWDWDILANEWSDEPLADWGIDFPGVDFGAEEDSASNGEIQEHEPELSNLDKMQVDVVHGDLIEIGRHRLVCGDSTTVEAVDKVLAGAKPELMVTDPPYGVEYDAEWRKDAGINNAGGGAFGKVSNDNRADWTEAWALSPAKVAYVWHASTYTITVGQSLEAVGFNLRYLIIWAKSNFAIGRGHYHHKHEPCWMGVKQGQTADWIGDRKQTTVWDIEKPRASETGHSTQKPIECMAKPIRNHSGDVYEPFGGSGTTMVACEQLGRTCYMIELEPKYCQVIINRMAKAFPNLEIKINGKAYVAEG